MTKTFKKALLGLTISICMVALLILLVVFTYIINSNINRFLNEFNYKLEKYIEEKYIEESYK